MNIKCGKVLKMKVLRIGDVTKKVGFGRSTIYALMKKGEFPSSIKLSIRSVGWLESEVDAWILAKVLVAQSF